MQSLTLINMIRAGIEDNFADSYTLEQMISVGSGWKVVYNVNQKYFIEDIIAYALIRNGAYCELIPITVRELHLPQSLQEFVLKDGYIGLITPENELVVNEHIVEDIEHLNVLDIKAALKKSRVKLE